MSQRLHDVVAMLALPRARVRAGDGEFGITSVQGQTSNAQDKAAQSSTVHLRADAVVDVRGDLLVGVMQLEVERIDVLRIEVIHDGRLHRHSDVVSGLGVGQHVELPCLHGDRRDGLQAWRA